MERSWERHVAAAGPWTCGTAGKNLLPKRIHLCYVPEPWAFRSFPPESRSPRAIFRRRSFPHVFNEGTQPAVCPWAEKNEERCMRYQNSGCSRGRVCGLVLILLGALALSGAKAQTLTTVVNFNPADGTYPSAGLTADANGNLFGTTFMGGASLSTTSSGYGTVFELSGSGFVPPTQFAGKPGTINCAGVSTSTLAHTYGGLAHAATGLHFTSVGALESAITSYCSQ